jgi:hypothetical protein
MNKNTQNKSKEKASIRFFQLVAVTKQEEVLFKDIFLKKTLNKFVASKKKN